MDHDKVSFSFDINHPLYIPFLHLLGEDEELLIEEPEKEPLDTRKDQLIELHSNGTKNLQLPASL